ncbi:pilus assembly protein TadG-related protein [Janibacter alittae]|uniref:Pilus assembly protein TadG-related protein n=1 Tax=Janibacter alittae TaxID=3115209 RepID=A0ABZ2MG32_9MICO
MRGLMRSFSRRGNQQERGAAATLLAVLLAGGGGVVMGMLAISIDIGNIMYERRQVQNAADATSLALAAECAKAATNCDPDRVDDLLGANSHDALGQYGKTKYTDGACASGTAEQVGTVLGDCTIDGDMTDLSKCPPLPSKFSTGIPYVETYGATKSASGDKLFLPFSKMLVTGEADDVSVSACARAAWGPPGSTGATLPITIGQCDWANKTAVGGVAGEKYAPSPPYTPEGNGGLPPAVPAEIAAGGYATGIFTHDSGDHKCTGSPGHHYPGGFAWLANSDCVATIDVGGWVDGAPGKSDTCSASELKKYIGTEVFIPIHVAADGTGKGGKYQISGVASFYFAGWHGMSGAAPTKTYEIYQEPSAVCTDKCNDSVSYIWGWFTSGQLPVGSIDPDADDFGVNIIKPAG